MLNQKQKQLLSLLTQNSKQSDREISAQLGVTQPTVSRNRKKLEEEGIIQKYTVIPELTKIGIDFVTFVTIQWKDYTKVRELEEFTKFLKYDKRVLFSAQGEGFDDKTKILMSFHKDYHSYELFLHKIRSTWKEQIKSMDSFIVSARNIITNFDFDIINRIEE